MKLGEGGEAFFVFETSGTVPFDLQTSPLVSPATSPRSGPSLPDPAALQEPDYLDIADSERPAKPASAAAAATRRANSNFDNPPDRLPGNPPPPLSPSSSSPSAPELVRPASGDWSGAALTTPGTNTMGRSHSDEALVSTTTSTSSSGRRCTVSGGSNRPPSPLSPLRTRSPPPPPPIDHAAAVERALALSRKLSTSNIQTHVTDSGDVMLDMDGYKLVREDAASAERARDRKAHV